MHITTELKIRPTNIAGAECCNCHSKEKGIIRDVEIKLAGNKLCSWLLCTPCLIRKYLCVTK